MAEEPNTVTSSFSEVHAGLKLKAGSSIVIVLADGHGRPKVGGKKALTDAAAAKADSSGSATANAAPAAASTAPAASEGALDLQLFTASGKPAANFEVELTLPDGTKIAGKTDANGKFSPKQLPPSGNCTLQVPDVDEAAPAAAAPAGAHQPYAKDMPLPIGKPAQIDLPPRVHRGELTGAHFETDKTFLLPTAMPGIKQLVIIYKSFGASSVLVNGHTDTVGPADYNRGLSEDRASSIAAFLTDDVATWMAFYKPQQHSDAWGVREDQHMLKFLGFYSDTVDGSAGKNTREAYRAFQESKGLDQTRRGDDPTRQALVAAYMATDGTTLDKDVKLAKHGCGLTHLKVKTPPGVANAENRRVEVYLFDGDVAPPPQSPCPPGGCAEHEQWEGQTLNSVDLDQPLPGLDVQVNDENGTGVDGVAVHLAGPTPQDGTTSGGGKASFPALVPGKYKAVASLDSFSAGDGETTVNEGANAPLVVTVQALAELEVTLTLAAPQTSGQVTATPTGKPAIGPLAAAPAVKFERLPVGGCTLNASAAFHLPKIQGANLVKGSNKVTIALDPFGEIAGTVTDGKNPVQNATLTLTGPSPKNGNTDAAGAFDFGNLPPGNYTLKIVRQGFEDFSTNVAVTATKTTLTIALTALTLDAFVAFEAWNLQTKKFERIPNMQVEAVSDIALGDKSLDSRQTDASGVAHFQVSSKNREPGEKIDLKFLAHPGGRTIGGAKFPDKWTTKGWKAVDGTPGMQKDFGGATLGTAATPVVFRVGLDIHLRVTYDVPAGEKAPAGNFRAVKGVEVDIDDVGKFPVDATGELHLLTFGLDGGDSVEMEVTGFIENGAINVKRSKFHDGSWETDLKDNAATSVGTQAAPFELKAPDKKRAACMYVFKVLCEWSTFLTHINPGDWPGIEDLDIFPHSISGTAYSFPVGTLNLPERDFFDRGTISHELSHQIMWKLADVSSAGIIGKVLTGKLHLTHVENLLTDDESHPLIEGWAEFIETLFTNARGYAVDPLTDDADHREGNPPIKLFKKFNAGEHCEGAFADMLMRVMENEVLQFAPNVPIKDTPDGNSFAAWMDDKDIRARWKSMIWDPLKDMKNADPFATRSFLESIKKRNPTRWHVLLPFMHEFNGMMEPPQLTSVSPASAAAGTVLTLTGVDFEQGCRAEFDGAVAAGVTVVSSTSLTVPMPAGAPGKVAVLVRTTAGPSNAKPVTRT